jgi:hypothetical protein
MSAGKRTLTCLLVAGVLGGFAAVASAGRSNPTTVLPWLRAAEQRTLQRVFGGARPVRTIYLAYPRKIAVVFEFDHVVICGACSAPSNASLPRGRVIRVSFDRGTHQLGGASDGIAMRFCESRGAWPPRANCLRR